MQQFTFIVAFVIGTVFFQMFLGDKMTQQFLILVLISMILFNTEKFTNLLGRVNANE